MTTTTDKDLHILQLQAKIKKLEDCITPTGNVRDVVKINRLYKDMKKEHKAMNKENLFCKQQLANIDDLSWLKARVYDMANNILTINRLVPREGAML